MPLYDHIIACNTHDLSKFRPFVVAGQRVGWVGHELAGKLDRWPRVFGLADDEVTLLDSVGGVEERTGAMAEACQALVADNILPPNRTEQFPVMAAFGDAPLLRLDRGGSRHSAWRPTASM